MHKLVLEARKLDRKIDINKLGVRHFDSPEDSSPSITTKLKNFLLFDFLPCFDRYTEPGFNLEEEASKRYTKVLNIAGEYIVDFVIQNGSVPRTWKAVLDSANHEFVFEQVIFHINRDVQVPEEISSDPYTELNDHLIPLHLFQDHWGARGILQQALANRRTRKGKGKGNKRRTSTKPTLPSSPSTLPSTSEHEKVTYIDVILYKCLEKKEYF
jgi:hypothetical protein